MLIGITGTPGTGKTAVTGLLQEMGEYRVIHLNELIKEEKLYSEVDSVRDCVVADMDRVEKRVLEIASDDNHFTIIDSHLSHHIADYVIVLRTSPDILRERLAKRHYSPEKIEENLEAEALDIILAESVDWCKKVFELNTTEETMEKTVANIVRIIEGLKQEDTEELEQTYKAGSVDWSEAFFS
jgi:adenylate kinase